MYRRFRYFTGTPLSNAGNTETAEAISYRPMSREPNIKGMHAWLQRDRDIACGGVEVPCLEVPLDDSPQPGQKRRPGGNRYCVEIIT